MSDNPTVPGSALDIEQINAVSGGTDACTAVDAGLRAIQNLTTAYESLVDFTSHVIERVITASTN